MVTQLRISSALRERIVAETILDPALEACGLLFGRGHLVTGIRPCRNVAADPAARFEIDPVALLGAHRTARSGGPAVIGCYHSHPTGRAEPSARDAADAAPDGSIWVIVAGHVLTAWRAVPGGALHGRFDPVAL